MRIGLVIYGSIETLTGGYLYDKQLVGFLTGCGHQIEIISLPARPYPLRLTDNLAVSRLRRILFGGYDLLIQDELCHPSLFLFNRRLRQRTGLPVVAMVHHVLCREPRRRMLNSTLAWPEKQYLNGVDGFIFNSRSTRDTVFSLSPRPRPFMVAPPGGDRFKGRLNEACIDARARQPGALRLLFLGLPIPRKGLLPLIEALGHIPRARWRLEVVGDTTLAPGYARQVRRTIADKGLEAGIVFRGTLDTAILAETIARSHILCMPFAYEGFGIATLEALHYGVPVLGCRTGATSELIRHGHNGLLFTRYDLRAVTAAVQMLHADRDCLARMSMAALRTAAKHPTWRTSMLRIEEFLTGLHSNSRRPPAKSKPREQREP